MSDSRVPVCQIILLVLSLSVLLWIGWQYKQDYKHHVETCEHAHALKEEICNHPAKVSRLHMHNKCHDADHDLKIDPHEMALKKFFTRWSLDGWVVWGGQYLFSIIGLVLTLFVILMAKGPLEWLLNKADDFTRPLIPTIKDEKKRF